MKTLAETDQEYICDIQAPCFAHLSPEEISVVKASKTQVLFRKGDNITKQGAFASYILFIIDGLAKQYLEGDGGRSYNLRIIQPGEFVGLSSVYTGNTFLYSSVALTDSRAFLVERDTIAKLALSNGSFGFGISRRYCQDNANLYATLQTAVFKQMNGRMAECLLYFNGLKQAFPDIFTLLTRKDLAEFAGVSMESAVKLLKAFEKDGLLRLNDKDVDVLNPAALTEISRRG